MRERCARDTQNTFYAAALILLEASQRHILRYAALAEELAQSSDATRREELLAMADIRDTTHSISRKPSGRRVSCSGT